VELPGVLSHADIQKDESEGDQGDEVNLEAYELQPC